MFIKLAGRNAMAMDFLPRTLVDEIRDLLCEMVISSLLDVTAEELRYGPPCLILIENGLRDGMQTMANNIATVVAGEITLNGGFRLSWFHDGSKCQQEAAHLTITLADKDGYYKNMRAKFRDLIIKRGFNTYA